MKRETLELARLASSIVGTHLVLIARDAKSPRHAARIAAYLGHDRNMIQATRWAAIIARRERDGEEKKGVFEQFFGPIPNEKFGEMPDFRKKTQIQIEHYCEAEGKWQPLNKSELIDVLTALREILRGKGARIIEISNPATNSKWPSSIRWDKEMQ